MPGDAELIRRVLTGQREAYAELVTRYERLVRLAAIRIVGDRHLADDVAQEAFLAAFSSLAALRNPENFGAWLLGIVRRQAARVVRKRIRAPVGAGDVTSAAEADGRLTHDSAELLELVESLPPQERVVLGLRHFEGHSMHEIARILDRPVGTVTKQISRAKQRLRNWLEQE